MAMVVVYIQDPAAALEQRLQFVMVAVQGDVEDGNLGSPRAGQPGEQADIALDAGDQPRCWPRVGQPQLVQGADAVCVAVKNIYVLHEIKLRIASYECLKLRVPKVPKVTNCKLRVTSA